MRIRGQHLSLQQRLAIIDPANAARSHAAMAAELGCSKETVRKWRRIARRSGFHALTPSLGRPRKGPLSTFAPAVTEAIRAMRTRHPGWGPATILLELQVDPAWAGVSLPKRAQVAAFLKHAGLTKPYQKHHSLPVVVPSSDQIPHERWELDAHGATTVEGIGTVSLINIVDVVSRLKVESYPIPSPTPGQDEYQLALRRAFLHYGLPNQISLDHGAVFFDGLHHSPFPSRIHLWLLALGVEVRFIRVAQPTDHAQIERTHQVMERQALRGQSYPCHARLLAMLDQRRERLNSCMPVRALQDRPPFVAYPAARHSGRVYRPDWEIDLLDLQRVYSYLAQGTWYRWLSQNGCFVLCNRSHYVSSRLPNREVIIRFDPEQVAYQCTVARCSSIYTVPARGLTKAQLMGPAFSTLHSVPVHQLSLPFSRADWQMILTMQAGLA